MSISFLYSANLIESDMSKSILIYIGVILVGCNALLRLQGMGFVNKNLSAKQECKFQMDYPCSPIPLDSLISENYLWELHRDGIQSIDGLIRQISVDEVGKVFPIDLRKSNLYDYELYNYLGIRCAAAIDLILSDSSQVEKIITYHPILFPIEDGGPVYKALEYENMLEIRHLYDFWWQKNRNRSLESIRNSYDPSEVLGGKYYWGGFPVQWEKE